MGWWGGRANVVPGVDRIFAIIRTTLVRSGSTPQPSQLAPNWGNAPRNAYFGPGFANWDISVMKTIYAPYSESHRLQVRADFLDAFNHFNPDGGLQTTVADTRDGGAPIPAAGRVQSGESSRVIQLSLKYIF